MLTKVTQPGTLTVSNPSAVSAHGQVSADLVLPSNSMMTYEPSSELVEWGLRFFENPVPSSEYNSGFARYATQEQSSSNSTDQSDHGNDGIIAHLLQADPSEVAYSPQPDYVRNWYHCRPSHAVYREYDTSYDEEDQYFSSMERTSDSELDEQVGKRLNQMIPVSHVPRINGEIPNTDEASSDYERLCNRLEFCGLRELKIRGDGNCQFRALSDQLFRSPEHHELVRQQVVYQLQTRRKDYEGYVPMDYSAYLKKISQDGAWGDHVTLQAAADSYGVKIVVVTSFKDTYYLEILPKVRKSERVLYLSFWAEVHYNSIYPQQNTDLNMQQLALNKSSKKRWWSFTSKH